MTCTHWLRFTGDVALYVFYSELGSNALQFNTLGYYSNALTNYSFKYLAVECTTVIAVEQNNVTSYICDTNVIDS